MTTLSDLILRVVVDTREQAPFTFMGLPVDVSVTTLEAGDYSLAGFERRVAVERKELQDLVGCLSGERARFERELARLRGYDAAAVVIEAPVLALRSGRYLGRLDAGAVTYDMLRHFARDRWRELRALAPAMLRRDKNSGQQVAERTP